MEKICKKGGGIKHKKEFWMYNFNPDLMELDNGNIVILGSPEELSVKTSIRGGMDMMQTKEVMTTTLNVGPVLSFYLNKAVNNLIVQSFQEN